MNDFAVITRTLGQSLVIGEALEITVTKAHRGKCSMRIEQLSSELQKTINVRRAEVPFAPQESTGIGVAVITISIGHALIIGEAIQITVTKAHRGKCRMKVKQLSSDPQKAVNIRRAEAPFIRQEHKET